MQGGECERSAAALAYCFVCVGFVLFCFVFFAFKRQERRKEKGKNQKKLGRRSKGEEGTPDRKDDERGGEIYL